MRVDVDAPGDLQDDAGVREPASRHARGRAL